MPCDLFRGSGHWKQWPLFAFVAKAPGALLTTPSAPQLLPAPLKGSGHTLLGGSALSSAFISLIKCLYHSSGVYQLARAISDFLQLNTGKRLPSGS